MPFPSILLSKYPFLSIINYNAKPTFHPKINFITYFISTLYAALILAAINHSNHANLNFLPSNPKFSSPAHLLFIMHLENHFANSHFYFLLTLISFPNPNILGSNPYYQHLSVNCLSALLVFLHFINPTTIISLRYLYYYYNAAVNITTVIYSGFKFVCLKHFKLKLSRT
jgi:hypothetical protein